MNIVRPEDCVCGFFSLSNTQIYFSKLPNRLPDLSSELESQSDFYLHFIVQKVLKANYCMHDKNNANKFDPIRQ